MSVDPFSVVIAGGGVAGLEGALALRDLAGDHVSITVIEPRDELVYRPMTVQEPFAYAAAERYPLDRIVRDVSAERVRDSFESVDRETRTAYTASGQALAYDALMLCLGARPEARYERAITIDDRALDELLHGLVQDIEAGYVSRLAFVAPPRMAWPLPLYELALMSARRAFDSNVEMAITLLTPEDAPLAVFGRGASQGVSELLAQNRIEVIPRAQAEIPAQGRIVIEPDFGAFPGQGPPTRPGRRELTVDRVIALPELHGPAVRGLPAALHGFLPIDRHCQVRDAERIFAAGDATDFPVKHGGISAQQADTAAAAIAALAGAPVRPSAFRPVIHGILLTGAAPRYLTAHLSGGHTFSSRFTDEPTWSPPTKIVAKYLSPYLEQHSGAGL